MMAVARRWSSVLIAIGVVLLSDSGVAGAHEPSRQRPIASGRIDPGQTFQFLAISAAGGHFHSLLPTPGLARLFAGTHLGLFRSEDRGVTWRLAAPVFSGEEIHGLAEDPKTGVLYVATHGQGLLLSRDGGKRWSGGSNGLPGRDLHALALDPSAPHVLYVWVVGHGLFLSDTRGARWTLLAPADALAGVESLGVHPVKRDRLYAGTARGVWVSDDGGRGWRLPAGGLSTRTAGVAVPPWQPDRLLAATLDGAFIGKAEGTGWEQLPSPPPWWGLPIGFAFLADQPEVIFAVTHEGVVAGLAGGEWTPAPKLP